MQAKILQEKSLKHDYTDDHTFMINVKQIGPGQGAANRQVMTAEQTSRATNMKKKLGKSTPNLTNKL